MARLFLPENFDMTVSQYQIFEDKKSYSQRRCAWWHEDRHDRICGTQIHPRWQRRWYVWWTIGAGLCGHEPMKRLGEPKDVAHVIAFLSSEAGQWLNGQTLIIRGGAATWIWSSLIPNYEKSIVATTSTNNSSVVPSSEKARVDATIAEPMA